MLSVFDVAGYFLQKQSSISSWKMQQMCYEAQIASMMRYGKPLFSEDFQAWARGPVCAELFNETGHYWMRASV